MGFRNVGPDFALVGMITAHRLEGEVDGVGLPRPGFVGHDVSRGTEELGTVRPTPLFGATDRDFGFATFFQKRFLTAFSMVFLSFHD